MPNWCENSVSVTGNSDSVKKFIETVSSTDEEGNNIPLSFSTIVPEPHNPKDNPDYDWWNWRIDNWGTKWDLDQYTNVDFGNDWVYYFFDTAWSPPIEFLNAAAKNFPDLTFEILFGEAGMWFSGNFIWQDGILVSSEEGEYQLFFPEEAESMISETEDN